MQIKWKASLFHLANRVDKILCFICISSSLISICILGVLFYQLNVRQCLRNFKYGYEDAFWPTGAIPIACTRHRFVRNILVFCNWKIHTGWITLRAIANSQYKAKLLIKDLFNQRRVCVVKLSSSVPAAINLRIFQFAIVNV